MIALLYAYPGCSTCRGAQRWLDAHGVAYREVNIATTPPTVADLRNIRQSASVPLRRLFNTSGLLYRQGNYATRVADMDEDTALAELASHGMLIRRPLLRLGAAAVVGFRPEDYAAALAGVATAAV